MPPLRVHVELRTALVDTRRDYDEGVGGVLLRPSQAELDRSWAVVALELLEHEAGDVFGEACHGVYVLFLAMIQPDSAGLAPLVLDVLRKLHVAGDDTLNNRLPTRVSEHRSAAGNRLGGRTALGLASEYGNLEVLELLLGYGARPDILDVYDRLPNDPVYVVADEVRAFWAARG